MSVLTCRPDFPVKKPEAVRTVLRALIRAENFVMERPEEARKIAADAIGMWPDQVKEIWKRDGFKVSLDQKLVLTLEEESRWAKRNGLTSAKSIPNPFDYICLDGMKSVNPDAVRILM